MPDHPTLAFVALVFLLAGAVKGVVGMGLPTVAMGALALAMPPAQAAALLVVPSLATNLWQCRSGPSLNPLLRRLAPMLAMVCVGTALGIGVLTAGASHWPGVALGAVLAGYGLAGLCLPPLSVPARAEAWLSPLVGLVTGLLTGATGVFVVPAVPYLTALGLGRDDLIQALGLAFTVSTLALAVGLGASGGFSGALALASLAALLPALAGMAAGQALRHRIDAARFRRGFFAAMVLVGAYMAAQPLLAG